MSTLGTLAPRPYADIPPGRLFRELSFTRPRDPGSVHRLGNFGVLPTDLRPLGDAEHAVAVSACASGVCSRLGRTGLHPVVYMIEACRQAAYSVAHGCFGIGPACHFVLAACTFEVVDPVAFTSASADGSLVVLVDWEPVGLPDDGKIRTDMRFRVCSEDGLVACVTAPVLMLSDDRYRRLRAVELATVTGAGGLPGDPRRVTAGRHGIGQLLSDPPFGAAARRDEWRLVVDTSDPLYFDHPCDHVPGLLLIDAFLQAAVRLGFESGPILAAPVVRRIDVTFRHFVDLVRPTDVVLERWGVQGGRARTTTATLGFGVRQGRRTAAEAQVELGDLAEVTGRAA